MPQLSVQRNALVSPLQQRTNNIHEHCSQSLLERGNKIFEKSVRRSALHFQSTPLQHVLYTLHRLQKDPELRKVKQLQNAIKFWEKHHPKEVAKRNTHLGCLKNVLSNIIKTHETPDNAHLYYSYIPIRLTGSPQSQSINRPSIPVKTQKISVLDLVKRSAATLCQLSNYACTDAATFMNPKDPGYSKAMNKLALFDANQKRQLSNHHSQMAVTHIQMMAERKAPITQQQLDNVAHHVHNAQAGCCSTLAFAAAAELLRHNTGYRIEILAHKGAKSYNQTHCFVVIGRDQNSSFTQPQSWGKQTMVIDIWKSSLFGGAFTGTATTPPITNLWPPTESIFDSTAGGAT